MMWASYTKAKNKISQVDKKVGNNTQKILKLLF